jgi:hypothetical protein
MKRQLDMLHTKNAKRFEDGREERLRRIGALFSKLWLWRLRVDKV